MPLPLLASLPATARVAYPFIRAGVRRGLSSRAIERVIRQAGLSISRARSIIPIMQAEQAALEYATNLRFVNKTNAINLARLPEALTPIRKRFSFAVRVRGTDPFGNLVERHVQVGFERGPISPELVELDAIEAATGTELSGGLTDVEVLIDEALQDAELVV